jgi:Flp pilus assembly protein TadG
MINLGNTTMNVPYMRRRSLPKSKRSGAAAVECAILMPLLALLVLGAIDVGQFANVYQKISDASREGARVAVRYETQTTSQVESAVINYLSNVSGGDSDSPLVAAAKVQVTDSVGNPVPGSDLTMIPSGSQVRVRVSLVYDPVRWIKGIPGLNGRQIAATTIMRHE